MSEALAHSLIAGRGLSHPATDAKLVETHISWLILTGDFAYKLKKPVNLGFLDFSSLEQRKHFCEEEMRLNQRTAPDIYLGVVPVSGNESDPRVGDDSNPFDYLVKMKRFDEAAILENLAREHKLDRTIISALASSVATFHESIAETAGEHDHGFVAEVERSVAEVLQRLKPIVSTQEEKLLLGRIHDWVSGVEQSLENSFNERRLEGFVRECHGDLHLGNILFAEGKCIPFDCLEFDPELRWIDTANDLAFTVMDLETHQVHDLAHQFLNEYLEYTGDYGCLAVLPYYLVYRALVRAMVCSLRAKQDAEHAAALRGDCDEYLHRALRYTGRKIRGVILMCGFSGSGKTTVARTLASELSVIHVRSDIERKRLYGLDSMSSSQNAGLDIYTQEASQRTFDRLANLTETILASEYGVIVDATFIDATTRSKFASLALSTEIPFCIVHCVASPETIKERLEDRVNDASEASLAQYETQRLAFDDFSPWEAERLVSLDTESPASIRSCQTRILRVLEENHAPARVPTG